MSLPPIEPSEVLAIQCGDREAFEAVARRAYPLVYRYIVARVMNDATAEDISQDVFLAAARGIGGLRDPDRIWSWLFGIASRQVHGWMRRATRGRAALAAIQPRDDSTPENSPDDPLARDEEHRLVHRALDELPPRQADALRLRHFEGLSYDDIATVLAVPRKTVDTWLVRGRQRFRATFTRLSDNE